ncbi:MAG TPA: DoxX family protein [Polyangiaceae bacterium]|nr:DoxX family protein [Polyangiaceae bacterium]
MEATATFSDSTLGAHRTGKWRIRAGFGVSALPVLFLLFDSVIKLLVIPPVVESFAQLGYPISLARGIGVLELVCLTLYLLPRTAVLGGIVLTGFLGGAISTHLRIGDPLFSHVLFPVYVGLLVWGGLILRDDTLRALLFARK